MNAPLYTTDILRLAASLGAPSVLDRIDGSANERAPTCGSRVVTRVQRAADGTIAAVAQDVHACAFGQASAALVARHAAGRSAAEVDKAMAELAAWLGGSRGDPGAWPGLNALAPARSRKSRHPAILLPFRSLLAALRACN
ncbi:MAG TPA: iron-sulfur cluster assembly scaffold protein [Sphingomicrobium sp.]